MDDGLYGTNGVWPMLRHLIIAWFILSMCWMCSQQASARLTIDNEVQRVRLAYSTTGPYQTEFRAFVSTDRAVLGTGEPAEYGVVRCDPDQGVVVDKTHPLQRRAAKSINGYVFAGDSVYDIQEPAHFATRRSLSPDVVDVLASSVAPTHLFDRLLSDSSEQGAIEQLPSGDTSIVFASGLTYQIAPDGTILSIDDPRVGTRTEFGGFQATTIMQARFPLEVVDIISTSNGPMYNLRRFDPPVSFEKIEPSEFDWKTYAAEMIDSNTRERIDASGNVVGKLDQPSAPPPSPNVNRPASREPTGRKTYLFGGVIGAALLVVAGAILAKRRLSAP
ncbi:MAG: hypothetical protein H7Y88_13210 [Phycisphaerales bacterium]|nr:hypothetical protein [Phycisphaerales bacterium]